MRRRARISFWLAWFMVAGALPAFANNPPAPDGMLSLVLLFPLMLLGRLWAGAELTEKERKWRVLTGILLGLAFLLTMGGTGVAAIPLLVLLLAGLKRAGEILQRGQGRKRVAIGGGLIVFTLFAVSNYVLSMEHHPRSAESRAAGGLRSIVQAEIVLQTDRKVDVNKNGIG